MLNVTPSETSFPGAMPLPTEVKCLLLDDSNFDRARIKRLSKQTNMAIEMDEVDSIEQLDKAVATENYDLILIDYRLPVGDGMEALERVMQSSQNRDAGKIMITGDAAQQTAVQAMRAGCHDFLTKEEMDAEVLRQAMTNALSLARQRQHLIQQAAYHQEIIRKGLIEAIKDSEVQDNVISLMRAQIEAKTSSGSEKLRGVLDPDDVDALLAGLEDGDDFVFH